jgi:hypothetical protein
LDRGVSPLSQLLINHGDRLRSFGIHVGVIPERFRTIAGHEFASKSITYLTPTAIARRSARASSPLSGYRG